MRRALRLDRYSTALMVILAAAFFLSTYFFYGPSPINGADNYLYAQFAYQLLHGNFAQVASEGILAQQFILLYGISAFYALFGVNRISEAGFGMFAFLLTIAVIYKIGAKLYSRNAGILSAAAFALNPIAIINSSYVGDNGPMALFVSLTVLFFVMGLYEKRHAGRWFIASGAFAMLGVLVTSQVIELAPFLLILLIGYLIARGKRFLPMIGMFAAGVAIGAAVIAAFGAAGGNGPLYILATNAATYSSVQSPMVQFYQYMQWLFQYNVISNFTRSFVLLVYQHTWTGFSGMLQGYITANNINFFANQSDGLYAYFAAAAMVFLVCRWNKRMLIPMAWFIATLLYMGLGSVSIASYVPISFAYPRLMLIFIPAMALLIGFAFADFLEARRRPIGRFLSYVVAVALICLLAINSIAIVSYVNLAQYKYIYPLLQISGFISMLPQGSVIYTLIPLGAYTGYKYNIAAVPEKDCNMIQAGSYQVLESNSSLITQCGLTEVYTPAGPPSYLDSYSLFDHSSYGVFYNYSVYVLR